MFDLLLLYYVLIFASLAILIWGNQDIAIGRAGVEMTKQYMKGEYSLIELDAGHALVPEKFERVNQEILSHIQLYPIEK